MFSLKVCNGAKKSMSFANWIKDASQVEVVSTLQSLLEIVILFMVNTAFQLVLFVVNLLL